MVVDLQRLKAPHHAVTKSKKKDKKKGKKAAAFDSDDEAVPAGEEGGLNGHRVCGCSSMLVGAPPCMSLVGEHHCAQGPPSADLPCTAPMQRSCLPWKGWERRARTMSR